MKTFYIFRHGQTYYSKNEIPYGENERTAHILPESRNSIEKIGEYLKSIPELVAYRSEFLRCQETAKIIESKNDFKFIQTPLLNEFTENEFPQFLARMKEARSFLLNLSAEHIAICTHGAVVAALQKLLVNQEFHAHELMYYPKTGVIVKVDGEHVTSIDLNS